MMRTLLTALVVVATLTATQAHAAENPAFVPIVVTPLPAGAQTKPVTVARLTVAYQTGQTWGTLGGAVCSLGKEKLKWDGVGERVAKMVDEVIAKEIKSAGFKVVGDDRDLFATAEPGEFAIGGVVTDLNASMCTGLRLVGAAYEDTYRGSLAMKVEWQIYSQVERRVVAKVTTSGGAELKRGEHDGLMILFRDAFADNVRGLINTAEFRRAFVGAGRPADQKIVASATNAPIAFAAAKSGQVPISDAVGSVVTVLTGGGHGSGVLVSGEGYVLTNSHVVGDNEKVRVRFSDGFEAEGQVVRSQRGRDVALIKTTPHGRQPLVMRPSTLEPGTPIFAVGAPLDEKFSSTVTKGIVSANRVFDGFSFIQSDVTINPGNSGGPLLDEQGRVVGLTVASMRNGDTPTGLNLFIPIGDAIDFLGLDPH